MPEAETGRAVHVLDLLLDYFGEQGERWTRDRYDGGDGRRCLVGALHYLRCQHRLSSESAECFLHEAIKQGRPYRRGGLVYFNDRCRSYAELRSAIIEARALALGVTSFNGATFCVRDGTRASKLDHGGLHRLNGHGLIDGGQVRTGPSSGQVVSRPSTLRPRLATDEVRERGRGFAQSRRYKAEHGNAMFHPAIDRNSPAQCFVIAMLAQLLRGALDNGQGDRSRGLRHCGPEPAATSKPSCRGRKAAGTLRPAGTETL